MRPTSHVRPTMPATIAEANAVSHSIVFRLNWERRLVAITLLVDADSL